MTTWTQSETAGDAGEAVGGVLAWIANTASDVWGSIGPTVGAFVDGVLRGAGLGEATTIELIAVAIGIVLIIGAGRAVFDGRILSAAISGAIGAALIAWAVAA